MNLEKREPSGREKNESAVERLEQLREKLYFAENSSARRTAAFRLSWMQEDGFEILSEVLFGDKADKPSRTAAAYGLRSMRGRMKKIARQALTEGAESEKKEIQDVCRHALKIIEKRKNARKPTRKPQNKRKKKIKEFKNVSHKSPRERSPDTKINSGKKYHKRSHRR
jgi:hypothetical protein